MKAVKTINPKDWMTAPEILSLLNYIQGSIPADEPQILLVGGCVRNTLLDKPVEDIDFASLRKPDEVTEILEKNGVKVIPTGLQHGTITAVLNDKTFEITTLRHDRETDGRHALVEFTDSWLEDAKRRDFTLNTLLMDAKGNIYDPLGQGIEDLKNRKIRFVGKPAQRIEEDHLRILRFFRFTALYGDTFDEEGLKACAQAASSIKRLSKERITQEFFKIMASDAPYDVLSKMFEHGVLKELDFVDYDGEFLKHFCTFQSRYSLNALSARLFVMASLRFENIAAMGNYILFPNVFLKDMKHIHGALQLPDLSCDHAVKRCIYLYGRAITAQALIIELVQDRVMSGYAPTALGVIQNWDVPDFPLSGEDLIKRGMTPGPELGKELTRLENQWIENDFKLDGFEIKKVK